jgi:hypothetical protein
MILMDAGPMVALVSPADNHHDACVEATRSLRQPIVTVWPVLAEVMHLLAMSQRAQDDIWTFFEEGEIGLAGLALADVPRIRALMRKYRDLPMDLADAALVRVAERDGARTIFTLDRRDFTVYRPAGSGRFVLIP